VSNQDILLQLQERVVLRKGLQTLRKKGKLPAVIHDHGRESMHVMGDTIAVNKVYNEAGKHHPVYLLINGKQHMALIKDVDIEPTKHKIRHVVFQAIQQNEKVTAEIPVVLEGDRPAEKASLLVLTQLDHVDVEALPNNLPNFLTVDATKLVEVGDHLTVADIIVPEGVVILTEPETQIAIVEMPRDQIAAAEESAAELAAHAGTTVAETTEEVTAEPTEKE